MGLEQLLIDGRVGREEFEISYGALFAVSLKSQPKTLYFPTTGFASCEMADAEAETVACEMFQGEIGVDVREVDVMGRETATDRTGPVPFVVGDIASSHDQRVDAQVGFARPSTFFTAEGVDDELQVGGTVGARFVDVDVASNKAMFRR